MKFVKVLRRLQHGNYTNIRRASWPYRETNVRVEYHNNTPVMVVDWPRGRNVGQQQLMKNELVETTQWIPTQEDIFAEDWRGA